MIKKKYVKPVVIKEKKLDFAVEMLRGANSRIVCRQCTNCHGCR